MPRSSGRSSSSHRNARIGSRSGCNVQRRRHGVMDDLAKEAAIFQRFCREQDRCERVASQTSSRWGRHGRRSRSKRAGSIGLARLNLTGRRRDFGKGRPHGEELRAESVNGWPRAGRPSLAPFLAGRERSVPVGAPRRGHQQADPGGACRQRHSWNRRRAGVRSYQDRGCCDNQASTSLALRSGGNTG
jgi:hypothetical protein